MIIVNVIAIDDELIALEGLENLVIKDDNSYAFDTTMIDCVFWNYLDGDISEINSFHGEYMKQYSWAEEKIYKFYE